MNPEKKQFIRVILTALAVGVIGFFACVLILQPIFSGRFTLPQNLPLGFFRLQFYGLILGAASLAGYFLAQRRRRKYLITESDAENIFLVVLVCGFLGARLYHVISELPKYIQHPDQILAIWNGGLSIFGAGLGGVVGLAVYKLRTKKYELLTLLDWLIPSVVIGQMIGRFGNFFNYELYGLPTSLPWKMAVPAMFRLPPYELNQFFHPLFLYEATGSAFILVLLLKLKLPKGRLFLLWLFLYNVMRFFLEFMRVSSVVYGGIRVNAIVSLVLAIIALGLWFYTRPNISNQNNELTNPFNS